MTDFGDDTRIVHLIQAVCHPYNRDYNHWSLNIQFKDSVTSTTVTGSLRCHMTVDAETGDTVYAVIANPYAITNNSVLTVDFPPIMPNLPVGYISQVIRNNNLHTFEYSSEGSGRRHWMWVLSMFPLTDSGWGDSYLAIQQLESANYLTKGSAGQLWSYLHSFWDRIPDDTGEMRTRNRPSPLIYGIQRWTSCMIVVLPRY
jgi:hypothetical protein